LNVAPKPKHPAEAAGSAEAEVAFAVSVIVLLSSSQLWVGDVIAAVLRAAIYTGIQIRSFCVIS